MARQVMLVASPPGPFSLYVYILAEDGDILSNYQLI
jgi:hypothetical protein